MALAGSRGGLAGVCSALSPLCRLLYLFQVPQAEGQRLGCAPGAD